MMKNTLPAIFLLLLSQLQVLGLAAISQPVNPEEAIRVLSAELARAEKQDDLSTFLDQYAPEAISMPEYQPTLNGRTFIFRFYSTIFSRQDVQELEKKIEEVISMDSLFVEIGTFRKSFYLRPGQDTLKQQEGKYWTVWSLLTDGNLKITAEAYGFFHPVEEAAAMVVAIPEAPAIPCRTTIELAAYNALNEKSVRIRDGAARSTIFTEDARFMPFQEPTVNGMDEIKPYLIAYSQRGPVIIDSIKVASYDYEYLGDKVLEYCWYEVDWRVPDFSGHTSGKGIRIWQRQQDGSLRVFREISTHNLS